MSKAVLDFQPQLSCDMTVVTRVTPKQEQTKLPPCAQPILQTVIK